ncbi:tRNA uracil 4-sulfurtransferase ThiI [Chitinivibrio alkaliphilus]|uniref:Probable tRNA sulfurtransferase n=1 Tax=Chitinivibrio alkaliphilus ACht1 TaxID=1313304 RepID=U7DA47_9BACT|nr:tRNA uracil 4-sulfurtransferase ThiI [Chitinivibrio alkaliphilus]ERP31992.1 thiamine biosynthesis/tRNA modification protein ThiI [Chitinivibrio alkaliphilus ACht1]
MTPQNILYLRFGELFLKGKNRHRFIDTLIHNLKQRLTPFPHTTLHHNYYSATIMLNKTPLAPVERALSTLFGIQSFAVGVPTAKNIETICTDTIPLLHHHNIPKNSRIRIQARRSSKDFPYKSIEIGQRLAQHLTDHSPYTAAVQPPHTTLTVQIRKKDALLLLEKGKGPGGMPVGTAGKGLLMLSGGIDSPVAAYLLMKRGIAVEAIHFESPPHTTQRARQKVFDLAHRLASYMPSQTIRVHTIPFTHLQETLFQSTPSSYGMTIMRRMMYRISHALAQKKGISLLANGESIGQVASQTVESMAAITPVTSLPVLRPLACMDKEEIISIARHIDTYDISIRPYDDCCTLFVPPNPATRPREELCQKYEEHFPFTELISQCLEKYTTHTISADKPYHVNQELTETIDDLL